MYVQDLIVDVGWKRQGGGRTLMEQIKTRFEHVRMLTLMKDAQDEAANSFYQAVGFRACGENGLQTYFW